jgi:hypothetical protein
MPIDNRVHCFLQARWADFAFGNGQRHAVPFARREYKATIQSNLRPDYDSKL